MKIGMLMCLQWEPLHSSVQPLRVRASWCWCAHLMGWTRVPRLLPPLPHSSLFSDTLACCLFAFSLYQAFKYPSTPPSVAPSLPPSLAGLYLPAVLGGNYQSSVTVSGCTAMLRFALPVQHTHTHMDTQIQCRHGPKQTRHSNYIDILLSNVCLEQSEGAFHCAASSIMLRITTSIVLMQVNEKEPSSCLMDFHALGYLQSIFSLICITFAGFHCSLKYLRWLLIQVRTPSTLHCRRKFATFALK